jgi:hypothetical protein
MRLSNLWPQCGQASAVLETRPAQDGQDMVFMGIEWARDLRALMEYGIRRII